MTTRRLRLTFTAFVAALAVAGCSTTNPVSSLQQPIDTAPPSAPTNIRGEERGALAILAWDESSDADVVGYDIYRYAPDPARESAYIKVNAATVTGSEYQVNDAASWYRVKAVDQAGNRSASSGAAYVVTSLPVGHHEPADVPVVRH